MRSLQLLFIAMLLHVSHTQRAVADIVFCEGKVGDEYYSMRKVGIAYDSTTQKAKSHLSCPGKNRKTGVTYSREILACEGPGWFAFVGHESDSFGAVCGADSKQAAIESAVRECLKQDRNCLKPGVVNPGHSSESLYYVDGFVGYDDDCPKYYGDPSEFTWAPNLEYFKVRPDRRAFGFSNGDAYYAPKPMRSLGWCNSEKNESGSDRRSGKPNESVKSDPSIAEAREIVDTFEDESMIVFGARESQLAAYVFVDVFEGYSQDIISSINDYNAQGVTLMVGFYSRFGTSSKSHDAARRILCAPDPKQALTVAMASKGDRLPSATCASASADYQNNFARRLNPSGSPFFVFRSGHIHSGYLAPSTLARGLRAITDQN